MMAHTCIYCFQDVDTKQDIHHWFWQDALLCGECSHQLTLVKKTILLDTLPVYVCYRYNEFLETMLFQYKESRDIALQDVFFHTFNKFIERRYRGYTLVLMPSSEEKTKERGFHALEAMLRHIHLHKISPFYKSENRKQSLQSFEQRQHIDEVIHLKADITLPQTKLLLVDDVCTTGATLKCAYQLLAAHTMNIEALVLCAHPLLVDEEEHVAKMSHIKKLTYGLKKGR